MSELVIHTLDWVPEGPRGYVRDLRVRWALEEAGLPYRVQGTPFKDRGPEHFKHQPFGQVPWLQDGDLSIFESGAIVLHIGEKCERLLPRDAARRAEVIEWVFAALNSVEMASLPQAIFRWVKDPGESEARKFFDGFLAKRLTHMNVVLEGREWLAGDFSIADILMSDVMRLEHRYDGLAAYPACKAYVERAMARPAFQKAHADQLAHFAAADALQAG